jgi:uncharacterized MAPEG superfamily protein
MSEELWLLCGGALLAIVQIGLASTVAKRQTGVSWSIGPRDEPRPLAGLAGRLERAQANLYESLPLFAIAVVVVELADANGALSQTGAHLFLWCRIAYVPAYAFGIRWVRTAFWQAAMIGILLIFAQLLW